MASTKKSVVKCICENAATSLSYGRVDSLLDCVYGECNGTTWNNTQWVENNFQYGLMCEYADGS
ncbi:hypothetical protein N7490_010173 [Penicillium lividum]|nr:hypothetical protein N7490_010173 [Penicillium lividum]